MDKCCNTQNTNTDCNSGDGKSANDQINWFADDVRHCLDYTAAEREKGRRIVGIMCEYTPREVIMAAGAIPVLLCGGDVNMIPAAEEFLPANLCPLIKSTFGYCVKKSNPFLEMADLIVAETTCDGKKKMYELMSEHKKMHVLELPQKPRDPDALAYWTGELHKLKCALEKQFNVTVTDDNLREAVKTMNRERKLRRELAALMKSDDPPLTGRELLDMKSLITGQPEYLERYEKALHALPGRRPEGNPGSRTRVLLTGVPTPHGAERVVNIIEKSGGIIVCQENCSGLKPILEDIDADAPDLIEAIAKKYYHLPCSVMTSNEDRMELLRELALEYKADCIVDLVWQACLTYDVESYYVSRLADELSLPYLRIETDYSPSDTARIETRVQALFETTR